MKSGLVICHFSLFLPELSHLPSKGLNIDLQNVIMKYYPTEIGHVLKSLGSSVDNKSKIRQFTPWFTEDHSTSCRPWITVLKVMSEDKAIIILPSDK